MSSFWINEVNEDQLDFNLYTVVVESGPALSIRNRSDNTVGWVEVDDLKLDGLYVEEVQGYSIEPEDISFISVKSIDIDYGDENLKEFLTNFFTEVRERGGTATWYPDRFLESGEYEYVAHSYRDIEIINDLASLVKIYNLLDDYSSEEWLDSKLMEYDISYSESDFPIDFGLTSYNVYYVHSLPPIIWLDPRTWSKLVDQAVGKHEYIDPLVEVPLFIITDEYQQFKDLENGLVSEPHEEWQMVSYAKYMLEKVKEIYNENSGNEDILRWAEKLYDTIVIKGYEGVYEYGTLEDE